MLSVASSNSVSFDLAGVHARLTTNSQTLITLLRDNTCDSDGPAACDFHVEVTDTNASPLTPVHFRGRNHLVVISFGAANLFLIDLLRQRIDARVSVSTADDTAFWHRTLFPIVAGLLAATIGILPVHAACVALRGNAMLIGGNSLAGKSTLALALALHGLGYIADDWTYCSRRFTELHAAGSAVDLKLLPDTVQHFQFLDGTSPAPSMNGEMAIELDPSLLPTVHRLRASVPRLFVLYDRRTGPHQTTFTPLNQANLMTYLEHNVERLPAQLPDALATRDQLMDAVSRLPAWCFTCSAPPASAADTLALFFDEHLRSHRL